MIKGKSIIMMLWFISLMGIGTVPLKAESNEVYLIELNDDTINPVTAEYISKAIDKGYENQAQCLIIKLDTPGGLLSSTRTIVKKILSAKIPVIVYIAPSGAHAGSAGVFITYASHLAAMAPSTNIGAAHPVQMDGGKKEKDSDLWDELDELKKKWEEEKQKEEAKGSKQNNQNKQTKQERKTDELQSRENKKGAKEEQPDTDPMSSKILQDTTAFIRTMAEKRNRNVDWAIKSVTRSSSITETEAFQLGVVEIIAKNEEELLQKLDGRMVEIEDEKVTLKTQEAVITKVEMNFRQKFFNILANPNIAYILLILGFYGLLYEVTHPGVAAPGILGVIFLILAFYSLQMLPTNYAGVALIILGLVLLVAEAFVPGWGLLTLGGAVCMILGSMMLFESSLPMFKVSMSLILSFVVTTVLIAAFGLSASIQAHRRKTMSGIKGMMGMKGDAQTSLSKNKEGKVFVDGTLWNAISEEENIQKGEKIVVVEVEGLNLKVKKFSKPV